MKGEMATQNIRKCSYEDSNGHTKKNEGFKIVAMEGEAFKTLHF